MPDDPKGASLAGAFFHDALLPVAVPPIAAAPIIAGTYRPAAVLHIVHGMAEHGGRYGRLAKKLCDSGVEVWAADQRGHGRTARNGGNDPGKGGLPGHTSDCDAFDRVAADLEAINLAIRAARPGVPLFLLGHSWGSFIAQHYISQGRSDAAAVDGCALSGTRGPGSAKAKAGAPFMATLSALKGRRAASPAARAVVEGPYQKAFRPARTTHDWLSRDEAEVDAYIADPLCGMLCSVGFYQDLAKGLLRIHRPEAIARIPVDLPIYIFCGDADPVGDSGASPRALVGAYSEAGIKNLEFTPYPGARHEPLNETNRDEASAALLSWILRRAQGRDEGKK